jgi:hypothetical protein
MFFFQHTINSIRCVSDILRPCFENIMEEENTWLSYVQDGARAHTTSYATNFFYLFYLF